ncbi:MAG TPA: SRPBCC family protein, partial [Anaerolineae bacterium]|nr:SRPBCC family protein [Anaerolineae bacterium]
GCIYNLQPVWEVRQKQEVYRITDEDCLFKAEMRIPAPLALAWEYLTDTGTYMQRQPGITGWAVKKKKGGRVAPGTEQHCAHGANNEVLVITIIDWQPLKYYTCAFALPLGSTMYATYKVSEIDDENTLVTTYFQIKGKRPWQTPIVSALLYFPMKKNFVGGVDALEVIFADLVSEDVEAGRIMPLPVSRPEAVG